MYERPLYPGGIRPPETFSGERFFARPLRLSDAEADYEAVMAAGDRLKTVFAPDDTWPTGLTLDENRVDLGWHEREFTNGHSYAWTILDPMGMPTIGCAYVYPADREGADAMAFWWFRPGREEADAEFGPAFRALVAAMPGTCVFPGRDIAWDDWLARPPKHRAPD